MAVEKIAYGVQVLRAEKISQCDEPLQVFLENSLRHGNAGFTEMTGLADMQVGNDQRFFFFPENTALCRKPELLPVNFVGNGCLHGNLQKYRGSGSGCT